LTGLVLTIMNLNIIDITKCFRFIQKDLLLWVKLGHFLFYLSLSFACKSCTLTIVLAVQRSINKQFGIDSFLDWEGHHWLFNPYSNILLRPQHQTFQCPVQLSICSSYPLIFVWSFSVTRQYISIVDWVVWRHPEVIGWKWHPLLGIAWWLIDPR